MLCHPASALAFAAIVATAHGAASAQSSTDPRDPIERLLIERGVLQPLAPNLGAGNHGRAVVADAIRSAQRLQEGPSSMILTALNFLDVRYRNGGKSEVDGFDCSGFTRHVFRQSGLALPPSADDQAHAPGLVAIERDELQPGDLVFFNTLQRTYSHVGIYVGGERFIHSPRTGSQVRVEDMRRTYWISRFTGGRRVSAWTDPLLAFSH